MLDDFDDFANEHSREKENHERLTRDTKAEWAMLKGLTSRFALDRKEFEGHKFEWAPFQAYYPEFMKLDNVAVIFVERERNGVLDCLIRFTRRPAEPGGMWMDEKSPLDPIEWSPKATIEGDDIVWAVPQLNQTFSSAALAEKIAIELSTYHLAYKKHYENWSAA